MDNIIKVKMKTEVIYEAILLEKDIIALASSKKVSLDVAKDLLAKEYIAKYNNYCLIETSGLQKVD